MDSSSLKRRFAVAATLLVLAWEGFRWTTDNPTLVSWSFGTGFATAALIFGFWGSVARVATNRKNAAPQSSAVAPEVAIDARLDQDESTVEPVDEERALKAAERIARYQDAG